VEGNSQTTNDTYDGIFVDGDSDLNNIQGNTVRQGVGANRQQYGININAGNCDDSLVIANDIDSSGVSGNFNDSGTGTISHLNRGWDDDLDLGTGGIISSKTVTCHQFIASCEFGKPVTNPPTVSIFGICQALEFTVGTDKAYYKFHMPCDWVSGTDVLISVHWTRSSTGGDDSTKTVKWQLKNLVINGTSENCHTGEVTDAVQDTYDSSSTTDQIVYETDDMTITAAEIDSANDIIIVELMAVTPTGTQLTDPAAVGLCITYTEYQVRPAS